MHMDADQTVPPPRWRQRLRCVIYILIFLIVAFGGIVALFWKDYKPLPALLRGLTGTDIQRTQAFQRLLLDNFPIGMPESEFISALTKALPGAEFEAPENWPVSENGIHYIRFGFPCRSDWYVWWTVDREKRLSGVFGRYDHTCL